MDSLTASVASTTSSTTLTVADSSKYAVNQPLEIDGEVVLVRSIASSTTLTVKRGAYGSTNVAHSSGASVLIKPQFFTVEILDAINYGLDMSFPMLYKEVSDASLTTLANTYEYAIPTVTATGQAISRVLNVELKEPGDLAYRRTTAWTIYRGGTATLKFRRLYSTGASIRIQGFGPFGHFVALTDTLDSQFPYQAEYPLVEFAASYLLESGEARRVRIDTGPIDARENANPGASMAASDRVLGRFERNLLRCAMPPLPRRCVAVM